MAEATESTQSVQDAPTGDAKPDEARGLRKQLNEAHATIKQQRTDLLTPAYAKLNLDPETGLGKAIAKEYDGAASYDALAEFATKEYGHVAPEASPDHPQAQQVNLAQAQLDQVGEVAGTVAPLGRDDTLAKAEAEGDYGITMAIKGQQIADMLKP